MATAEPDGAVLLGLDDAQLIEAMDANAAYCLAAVAQRMDGEVYTGPDMVRYVSGLDIGYFNGVGVVHLPKDQERLDASVAAAMTPFVARSLPMLWWVSLSSTPSALGERLVAYGLEVSPGPPGMAASLDTLDALGAPAAIPGVTIAPFTDEASAAEWGRVAAIGFGMPESAIPPFTRFCARSLADPAWAFYLAYRDGQAVGSLMTFLHAGVAGIYTVATVPEARRLGVARALTHLAMLDARAAGYHVAILQASEMGFNLYRGLGFATIFDYLHYFWAPA